MARQFKYIKKMTELGFTEETVSKGIKGMIESLRNAQAAHDAAPEDKKAGILEDIENIDEELVDAVTKYPAKLENAKKMLAGKQAKQAGRTNATSTPPVVATAPIIAADGGKTEQAPTAETKEEKKGSGGLWGFIGLLAVGAAAVLGFKAYQNRA